MGHFVWPFFITQRFECVREIVKGGNARALHMSPYSKAQTTVESLLSKWAARGKIGCLAGAMHYLPFVDGFVPSDPRSSAPRTTLNDCVVRRPCAGGASGNPSLVGKRSTETGVI